MFRNYFKIALRNFVKDKTYALINLIGLAIGLACVIMIAAYVRYELSYDKHYSNSDRIYRLTSENKNNDNETSVMLPASSAATMKAEFPEIEAAIPFHKGSLDVFNGHEPITIQIISTDNNFFKVFNLRFVEGNAASALQQSGSIVISQKTAETFFGHADAMGKSIACKDFDGKPVSYNVTGIMENIPDNTHFKADAIFANNKASEKLDMTAMYYSGIQYILLNKNSSINGLQNKLSAFTKKYGFPANINISFQPVQSIHLHSNIADEPYTNSDVNYVYIFSFVALLILLIACINYINLTTARSLERVREVGVRKVLGANTKQLAFQFTAESLLFFLIALPVALLLSRLSWPLFTRIINLNAGDDVLFNWQNILAISVVSCSAGILSGLYPSLFISKLQPSNALKNVQKNLNINFGIRKGLIVLQFVISVVLIISTIIVYQQLQFVNTLNLGFNKEHLLVLPDQKMGNKVGSFKNELLLNNSIRFVSIASWSIGERFGASSSMGNPADSTKQLNFVFLAADFDFIKTMEIQIAEGRNFNMEDALKAAAIDSTVKKKGKITSEEWVDLASLKPIIITENTANSIGLKRPFANQRLKMGALQGTVVGVVKDFQGLSLHEKTPSIILQPVENLSYGHAYLRIDPHNIPATLSFIESKWKQFFPNSPYTFSFVDEKLQRLYDSEKKLASLFSLFALMAILIACSGLFSLVALTVQQRTKEIGIRKVLGASVAGITSLLSKDFIKLVFISLFMASPIAWLAMNKWLQSFAYRVNVDWRIFVLAGSMAFLIALVTVGFQSVKAALMNPVKSLRSE